MSQTQHNKVSATSPVRVQVVRAVADEKTAAAETVIRPSLALDQLVGGDENLKRSINIVKRLLNNKINFLIEGETGTGKELFARAIHKASNRADKHFVAVNCAAIPESLIESELFGYTPGTFTGARHKGMQGLIQQSCGGTLFLDEIGDMPLSLQTRLLRVLSEHELMPLGSDKPIPLDLNVIAATHRDIERLVADNLFRDDLYFRIAGATFTLPPLRDRADKRYVIESALVLESGGTVASISEDAMQMLLAYSWPGNIRELRNALRYACAICDGNAVSPDHLPRAIVARTQASSRAAPPASNKPKPSDDGNTTTAALLDALKRNKWNITDAATDLGMSRATIYRHMKRQDIVPPNKREGSNGTP